MSELNFANNEISGFGSHSAHEVEKLQKALGLGGQGGIDAGGAGAIVGPDSSYANQLPGDFQGGNALAVEDLDRTLKLVTFGLEHLRLWKDILKERVPQVVHEYNVQNAYGESDASPFFQMGNTPAETDAQYARDVIQIKYLGTKGAVLHNLTLIQAAHGPVVAREVKNKTIELLARNERAMFEADQGIASLEYDGIDKQIIEKAVEAKYLSSAFAAFGENDINSIVMNASGADLDEDICEDAGLAAVNNFGMPMDMYLGTDIHSAFSRAFYAKQRTVPGDSLTSGNRVKEHMGTLDYRFKPSLFNRPRKTYAGLKSGAAQAADYSSSFTGTTGTTAAGAYYAVPVYNDGEGDVYFGSDISTISLAIIALTQSGAVGDARVNYWNIYFDSASVATTADGVKVTAAAALARMVFVRRIPLVTAAIDVSLGLSGNAIVPGSGKAYLLMHDPDVLCWKQLGSMIKYDLAVTTTAYEWLQLLYGTPLIMAPRKNIIIENLNSN